MKASLKIEAIGDNSFQEMRFYTNILNDGAPGLGDLLGAPKPDYWVAMITGYDKKYGYSRQFLRGKKDYKKSNSVGSRGIYLFYLLDSGYIYEVSQPITWQKTRRYYCTVIDDGEIIEIGKDLVDQWVKDH
jgi:hypothetical protein